MSEDEKEWIISDTINEEDEDIEEDVRLKEIVREEKRLHENQAENDNSDANTTLDGGNSIESAQLTSILNQKSGIELVKDIVSNYDLPLTPPLSPLHVQEKQFFLPEPNNEITLPPNVFFTKESFEKYSSSYRSFTQMVFQRYPDKVAPEVVSEPDISLESMDVEESPVAEVPVKKKQTTSNKKSEELAKIEPKKSEASLQPSDSVTKLNKVKKSKVILESLPLDNLKKPVPSGVTSGASSESINLPKATPKLKEGQDLQRTTSPLPLRKAREPLDLAAILQNQHQMHQKMQQYQQQQQQQQLLLSYQVLQTRRSYLSEEEHNIYLDLLAKYHKDQQRLAMAGKTPIQLLPPPILTPEASTLFTQLRARVLIEQDEYRKMLSLENQIFKDRYFIIRPEIEKQLEPLYEYKKDIIKKYPRFYDVYSAFDLRMIKVSSTDPILRHKATVLQKGRCLGFQRPASPDITLDTNYFPLQGLSGSDPKTRWTKKKMPSLLEDTNITELLKKHEVDIVMCSSTLVKIIDNHEPNYLESWEIPVTIQSVSTNRKVIFLEKPLLRKKMTVREKNNYFYDIAFKTLGLQMPKVQRCIDFTQKASSEGETREKLPVTELNVQPDDGQDLSEDDNYTYNIWQFGEMKILIRCKIHGMVPDNKSPQGFRCIGIKTKLEYQPNRGLEEITISETARWWIYTYIRPDAHLILGRINIYDSKIMEVDHKDMINILPSGCLFKPEKSSKVLFTILERISVLQEGNYIISHKAGDYNVVILESVKDSSQELSKYYDLHEAHKRSPLMDIETIPYIPVRWMPKPNQIAETFPIDPEAKSTILEIAAKFPDICPNFVQFGSCTVQGCPLVHKYQETSKSITIPRHFKKYCHSFALMGFCRAGSDCKYPHLTLEELSSMQKKRKKKKKKKSKRQKTEKDASGQESSNVGQVDQQDAESGSGAESDTSEVDSNIPVPGRVSDLQIAMQNI